MLQGYQLGRVLSRQYSISQAAYKGFQAPQPAIMFKTAAGNFTMGTKVVRGMATSLKVGGAVVGGVGVVMTGVEIYNGNKNLIGEGGLDLIMGGVGFIPGGGWVASGLYFGGKYVLQETGNDFWNK